jgi:hypothetical protein
MDAANVAADEMGSRHFTLWKVSAKEFFGSVNCGDKSGGEKVYVPGQGLLLRRVHKVRLLRFSPEFAMRQKGMVWLGLVWCGLVRFGLAGLGLATKSRTTKTPITRK